MTEVQCPYCDAEQEICHDDGYGYDEDKMHEQSCSECERTFRYTTALSFSYSVYCDGDHIWESWAPGHPDMEGCLRCGKCRLIQEQSNA